MCVCGGGGASVSLGISERGGNFSGRWDFGGGVGSKKGHGVMSLRGTKFEKFGRGGS